VHPSRDLLLFPLFGLVIFGRFRAFALILLQIRIHPPPPAPFTTIYKHVGALGCGPARLLLREDSLKRAPVDGTVRARLEVPFSPSRGTR
jgi:hypothetical protein